MLTTEQALQQNNFTVLTCGGGVNFTALILEWFSRGLKKPDLIVFADTGSERERTYQHLTIINNWLLSIGWPQIKRCHVRDGKTKEQVKLHELCLKSSTLPPPAFAGKSCSLRFKVEQVDIFINNHLPAKEAWGKYRKLTDIKNKITRVVGFDAGEDHRRKDADCDKYNVIYPLMDWDIDRDDCIEIIKKSSLPLPIKSSCYMCPNMKAPEIREMALNEPEALKKALEVEDAFLKSDNARGRHIDAKLLRRIEDDSLIGIIADMDKKEVDFLLGDIEVNVKGGGLDLDFMQPEPVAYVSIEKIWTPSKVRGLGRSYSWREVISNPELNVGSDMPCMCND
jgi:hypothetical protein